MSFSITRVGMVSKRGWFSMLSRCSTSLFFVITSCCRRDNSRLARISSSATVGVCGVGGGCGPSPTRPHRSVIWLSRVRDHARPRQSRTSWRMVVGVGVGGGVGVGRLYPHANWSSISWHTAAPNCCWRFKGTGDMCIMLGLVVLLLLLLFLVLLLLLSVLWSAIAVQRETLISCEQTNKLSYQYKYIYIYI